VDYVGQYAANPWGLKDIIGNVSEWTRSSYRPYPYSDTDGRNDGSLSELKVARGGSWASRPRDARSAIRLSYQPYQQVHDVGLRVICED
jgi:formylglycine-generating enzyme required for sulfatase activity